MLIKNNINFKNVFKTFKNFKKLKKKIFKTFKTLKNFVASQIKQRATLYSYTFD